MPAKRMRLRKLVDAISEILGNQQKVKKLKKAKALERFIAKLQDTHLQMKRELKKKSLGGKAAKEKARQAESLGKQIKKAKKILADMK